MAEHAFDQSTVVATYSTLYEAELAQSHLDENDIASFVSRDDSGGMDPHMQLTRGVHLVVRSEEATEARQILEWMDAVPYKEFAADDAAYEAQRLRMWRQLGVAPGPRVVGGGGERSGIGGRRRSVCGGGGRRRALGDRSAGGYVASASSREVARAATSAERAPSATEHLRGPRGPIIDCRLLIAGR